MVARYFSSCYDVRLEKVVYNLKISLWQKFFKPQISNSTGQLQLLRHRDFKKTCFPFFLLGIVVAIVFTLLHYSFLSPFSPQLEPNSHWFFSLFNFLFYLLGVFNTTFK